MPSKDVLRVVMRRFGQRLRIRKAVFVYRKLHKAEPEAVEIMTYSGVKIEILRPGDWLKLFDDVYGIFGDEDIAFVVREWCDGCKSATVAAELNAMARRTFYEKNRMFFGFALGLAVERGLVHF